MNLVLLFNYYYYHYFLVWANGRLIAGKNVKFFTFAGFNIVFYSWFERKDAYKLLGCEWSNILSQNKTKKIFGGLVFCYYYYR